MTTPIISIHICGNPNDPRYTPAEQEIIRDLGVEGLMVIDNMRLQEQQWKEWEELEDAYTERIATCQNCGGETLHECPDAEFDNHEESTCRYACMNGQVLCHCIVAPLDIDDVESEERTAEERLGAGHILDDNEERPTDEG